MDLHTSIARHNIERIDKILSEPKELSDYDLRIGHALAKKRKMKDIQSRISKIFLERTRKTGNYVITLPTLEPLKPTKPTESNALFLKFSQLVVS